MIPTHTEPANPNQPLHSPTGQQVHTTETPTPREKATEAQRKMDETQRRIKELFTRHDQEAAEFNFPFIEEVAKEKAMSTEQQHPTYTKPRKGDKIPYGKGRTDVRWVITQNARPNARFNHHDVWSWMDRQMQDEWRWYYGTTKKAISRVAQALNSIYQKVPNSQFDLVKVKHKAATYVWRPKGWVEEPLPELDEHEHPDPKPTTRREAVEAIPATVVVYEVAGYSLFGTTTEGEPIFLEENTGKVGFVEFVGINEV